MISHVELKLRCRLYPFILVACDLQISVSKYSNSVRYMFVPIEAIVIKPSNIRIWIHDKDVGKLAKVVWEGQGNRLRTEVSSNGKVKKFLEAVPFVMVRAVRMSCVETIHNYPYNRCTEHHQRHPLSRRGQRHRNADGEVRVGAGRSPVQQGHQRADTTAQGLWLFATQCTDVTQCGPFCRPPVWRTPGFSSTC